MLTSRFTFSHLADVLSKAGRLTNEEQHKQFIMRDNNDIEKKRKINHIKKEEGRCTTFVYPLK